jgi:hypothetical protein
MIIDAHDIAIPHPFPAEADARMERRGWRANPHCGSIGVD